MHGIYRMNEGELRLALVQAQRLGADTTARRLELELAHRFARSKQYA